MRRVEVVQQHDKGDQHANQRGGPDHPPHPPQRLPPLEEAEGFADEEVGLRDGGRVDRLAGVVAVAIDGHVREFVGGVLTEPLPESVRGVEQTHAETEPHEEAADVGEVVETREESEHETDGNVDGDEGEVDKGSLARLPGVEEVEEDESDDAKEAARRATRC